MEVDPTKIQMESKIIELSLVRDLEAYKELCNESTIYLQKKNEDAILTIENRMLETGDNVERYPHLTKLMKKLIGDTIGAIFENQSMRKSFRI